MSFENQPSRFVSEVSSLIIYVLNSSPIPFPLPFPRNNAASSSSSTAMCWSQLSPVAWASLFLGISVALMLFGSVTFVIGLIMMPWVMGLVILFCFAGIVSSFSELCGSIICHSSNPFYHNHLHSCSCSCLGTL